MKKEMIPVQHYNPKPVFYSMKRQLIFIPLTALFICSCTNKSSFFDPVNPEEHGFSSTKLDSLTAFLETSGSSSLMILKDGKNIYEWGSSEKKHTVHSIRKALLNSLIGIYVSNGTIDTTATLASLGIDDIDSLTTLEKSATIADILRSQSGIYHPAAAVSEGMLRKMPPRGSHKPGEAFYYNNWGFNVLGHALEQKTGKSIYDLFLEDIAKPLGMSYQGKYTTIEVNPEDNNEDFVFPDVDGFYQYERHKSKYPAYHFRLSARDLALYGQLYLQNGNWKGEQVVPKEWIEYSTKPYNVTYRPAGLAYGIFWRVLMKTETRSSASFYHTGVGIHMLGVYPKSQVVLVHRVQTEEDYNFGDPEFMQMIGKVWASEM
jgi:CubicO group peptidase (beta-lactamase class C family)